MHAKHPQIAKRWDRKYGGKIKSKRKRDHHGEVRALVEELRS